MEPDPAAALPAPTPVPTPTPAPAPVPNGAVGPRGAIELGLRIGFGYPVGDEGAVAGSSTPAFTTTLLE